MNVNDQIASPELDEMLKYISIWGAEYIEYGNPDKRWIAALRIRYIATHSGMQFAIKMVNGLGQEGSGEYFQESDLLRLKLRLAVLLERFMKPDPRIQRMIEKLQGSSSRTECHFFLGNGPTGVVARKAEAEAKSNQTGVSP